MKNDGFGVESEGERRASLTALVGNFVFIFILFFLVCREEILEMSAGVQNQGTIREHLKEQLALAVRNIQWSYAIFWSTSAAPPGYTNGHISALVHICCEIFFCISFYLRLLVLLVTKKNKKVACSPEFLECRCS